LDYPFLGVAGVNDPNELLDISEAAQFLNVSEASLRRWTNADALPCLRIGRRRERRFRRGDLVAFMERSDARQSSSTGKGSVAAANGLSHDPVTVARGDHLCGIYENESGLISLTVPFLLDGLRKRSFCILIASKSTQTTILTNLRGSDPTIASDIEKGRIRLCEYEKSARAEWKAIDEQLTGAQAAGDSSFRIVGDVTGIRASVSPEELIEYEMGFDDRIVARFQVAVLCLYDARVFSGLELLNALKVHRDTLRYPIARALA
jgi:excisionase family DNA binding protein